MDKISLRFHDAQGHANVVRSFHGTWLLGDEQNGSRDEFGPKNQIEGKGWSVARTARGALVVYFTYNNGDAPDMQIYPNFEIMKSEAEVDDIPQTILAKTAGVLGIEYELELDI